MQRYPTKADIENKLAEVNELYGFNMTVRGSRDYPWEFGGEPLLAVRLFTKQQIYGWLCGFYVAGTEIHHLKK